MAYNMKRGNSGVKFKDLGSSPAKQKAIEEAARKAINLNKKLDTNKSFDIGGYFRGEQGLIPDYKGESTAETATKVSQAIQKGAGGIGGIATEVVKKVLNTKDEKPKPRAEMKIEETKSKKRKVSETWKRMPIIKIKPIGLQKTKVDTQTVQPKKKLVKEKMKVPYAYPGGPRVESFPLSKEEFTKGMLEGAITSGMGKVSGGMKKGKKPETND